MQAQSWACFELKFGHNDLHGLLITQLLHKVRCSLSSRELGMSWKSSPGLLRTASVRVVLGGPCDVLAHFPWDGDTPSLQLAVLFTGCILSILFQWHLENLWALRDLGSIFSRGWLGWCLREKGAQKTLHHLHALQLWVSYWSMEGEHVFANSLFSSLRGWNLQFSGWGLIWKIGVEHKCYFKIMLIF